MNSLLVKFRLINYFETLMINRITSTLKQSLTYNFFEQNSKDA